MNPEIIRNMPEAEYRARPEKSQSDYKHFSKPTPAHAKWAKENRKEIAEFGIGHALHGLVLEGKVLFAVEPKADGRTNAGKAIKAAFAEENQGKIILSADDGKAVEGMAAGILRNKTVVSLLESAKDREVSIFWDGMKARLDAVSPLGVLDLKTTGKVADRRTFSKSIFEFGYHIQGAMYLMAAAKAGFPCEDFFFICCESFPPHECNYYPLGHESLEVGKRELDRLKALCEECEKTGVYPGYPEEQEEINIPTWMLRREEGEM